MGLAMNMVRSPLRMHEEQKLRNDSPTLHNSSFKAIAKPQPRDFSSHPPIAQVMAPFMTPQINSSKFAQTPGGPGGFAQTPGNPYSVTAGGHHAVLINDQSQTDRDNSMERLRMSNQQNKQQMRFADIGYQQVFQPSNQLQHTIVGKEPFYPPYASPDLSAPAKAPQGVMWPSSQN